ncbi:hypothetical protein R1sor_016649 [Riccia sorocarpa]|uniref:Uncharacterized protein n=1 Tax=Riccia sorocarpa TaxID=122646 RepID=A0ABD3HJ60_9MARC
MSASVPPCSMSSQGAIAGLAKKWNEDEGLGQKKTAAAGDEHSTGHREQKKQEREPKREKRTEDLPHKTLDKTPRRDGPLNQIDRSITIGQRSSNLNKLLIQEDRQKYKWSLEDVIVVLDENRMKMKADQSKSPGKVNMKTQQSESPSIDVAEAGPGIKPGNVEALLETGYDIRH